MSDGQSEACEANPFKSNLESRVAWLESALQRLLAAKVKSEPDHELRVPETAEEWSYFPDWLNPHVARRNQTGGCCGAPVRDYDPSFLAMLRTRLMHGFSLSIDEQRRLFYLAGGERIESRKRCPVCNATGEYVQGGICQCCDGEGYHETE